MFNVTATAISIKTALRKDKAEDQYSLLKIIENPRIRRDKSLKRMDR